MLRWYFDLAKWQISSEEFDSVVRTLGSDEQKSILRFIKPQDRNRALVSRLLQRAAIRRICNCPEADIRILRTKGQKPFCNNVKPHDAPNFNYNVSHEGSYVVLASEPYCLCGVDVTAPHLLHRPPGSPLSTTLASLRGSFAQREWDLIQSHRQDDRATEACFQRLWSLKEAYIKARGDGLGFEPLSRAEFSFEGNDICSTTASLRVDGLPQSRWRFDVRALGDEHWVSVARGPPEAAVDSDGVFSDTLGRPAMSDDELQKYLDASWPDFEEVAWRDLLPQGPTMD